MRVLTGGVAPVSGVVEDDLREREAGLRQQQEEEGRAELVACALSCRGANTAEWPAVFPRHTGDHQSKERSSRRF